MLFSFVALRAASCALAEPALASAAHLVLALSLPLGWFRLLQAVAMLKTVEPLIWTVGALAGSVVSFVALYFIVTMGFAQAFHALAIAGSSG